MKLKELATAVDLPNYGVVATNALRRFREISHQNRYYKNSAFGPQYRKSSKPYRRRFALTLADPKRRAKGRPR